MPKDNNDVITLKSTLEIQYNVAKIGNAQNELQGNPAQPTEDNTNLKAELQKDNGS